VAGVVVGAVVALGLVYAVAGGSMRRAVNELRFIHTSHGRLVAIVRDPAVAVARRSCGPLTLPNYKLVPDARWILDAPASGVRARSEAAVDPSVALVIAGRKAVDRFGRAAGAADADNRRPPRYREIAANPTFSAYSGCAAPTP
jgi:hypothetical protein